MGSYGIAGDLFSVIANFSSVCAEQGKVRFILGCIQKVYGVILKEVSRGMYSDNPQDPNWEREMHK